MEYLKSRINLIVVLFYFLIGFFCTVLFLGFENISFTNIDWIFHGKDMSTHFTGWSYFVNDEWRFPLGANPMYGLENSSSIVYSDSIPILALFFKIFKDFLPNSFQYFSFWIFLCFFLQGYISYKIINHYTNNKIYSLIASFFFLIAPVFIYRISFHLALGGHWLIIACFYIETFNSQKLKNIAWNILIPASLLVHFYLAASCIIIYGIFFLKEILEKKSFKYYLKKIIVLNFIIISTMYLAGYFMIPSVQTLGVGFGILKLNLLGIFDPLNIGSNFNSWSLFLPDLPSIEGEMEGFSYLGLGIILLAILCIYFIFLDIRYKKKIFYNICVNKKFYTFIFFIFFFLSLSNNIDFGHYELLHYKVNTYIYGMLSVLRASGRMFWPAYYLILIFTIIFVFRVVSEKKSILILSILLLIQIVDTSSGLKQLLFSKKFEPEYLNLKGDIWDKIAKEEKILRTTFVRNATSVFKPMSFYLTKNNIKSDIFWHARYDREKAAESRYSLYNKLSNGLIDNVPYLVGKKNHLLNIKENFKKSELGFFFRDNFWIIIPNKKEDMTKDDIIAYDKINFSIINLNEKIIPEPDKYHEYFGVGWSHNQLGNGLWTEGYISSIFFESNFDKNINATLEIEFETNHLNNNLRFNILINDNFVQSYDLSKENKLEKMELKLKKNVTNRYKIDFKFLNPLISPLEALKSPDARKLGLLIKSLKVKI